MDIGLVEASEVGGKTPSSESLEPTVGVIDCAWVEEERGFEVTRGFVLGGSKGLFLNTCTTLFGGWG